jgi:predicted nucleotidyltransferase
MEAMVDSTRPRMSRRTLEALVHRELPHLARAEAADLARIVSTLVSTFRPARVYAFGSQARGTPTPDSDLDLLVVVDDAGEYPHRLDQAAHRAVGRRLLPLDILFMSADEFSWRAEAAASLPATVLREGRLLYDAAA